MQLNYEDLTSTRRPLKQPEQYGETEATCFQQAHTNKLKLLPLTPFMICVLNH